MVAELKGTQTPDPGARDLDLELPVPSSLHETIVSFLPGSERMETAGLETSVVMMPAKVQSRATAQGMPRAPSFPLSPLSLCLFSSRFPPCSPLSLSLSSLSLSLPTLIPLLPPPFLSPTPFFSPPLSLKLHLPSPSSHTNALPSVTLPARTPLHARRIIMEAGAARSWRATRQLCT